MDIFMNTGMDKANMRKEKLKLRNQITGNQLSYISDSVAENIRSLLSFQNADVIYFYFAVRNEVRVTGLLDECLSAGKKCLFPKVINDYEMEFFAVDDVCQLKEGYKGICEPTEACPMYDAGGENSIMLVPGTVFDRHGGRIGMGKGFYDRYIHSHRINCLAGVCGEYQLVEKVPMDKEDAYMDIVVTESYIYKEKGKEK